jgi:hypothetical protein
LFPTHGHSCLVSGQASGGDRSFESAPPGARSVESAEIFRRLPAARLAGESCNKTSGGEWWDRRCGVITVPKHGMWPRSTGFDVRGASSELVPLPGSHV